MSTSHIKGKVKSKKKGSIHKSMHGHRKLAESEPSHQLKKRHEAERRKHRMNVSVKHPVK